MTAASGSAARVTSLTLMTSDRQSNACRTAVESKSNRSCDHCTMLTFVVHVLHVPYSADETGVSAVPTCRQAGGPGRRRRAALSGQRRGRGPRVRVGALSVDAGRSPRSTRQRDAARLCRRLASPRPRRRRRRRLPRLRTHPPTSAAAADRNRKLGVVVAWERAVGRGDGMRRASSRATGVRVGRGTC